MQPALATRTTRLEPPTGTVLQVILGSLLGDSMLDTRPTHPRISMTHGAKQAAYVAHKASILSAYVRTPPRVTPNMGFGSETCAFRTVTTPAFDFLRDLCTVDVGGRRRKVVTPGWLALLTWEGVAFWFMDDGHIQRASAGISTHSFSEAEVRLLAEWFASRGAPPRVDTVRTHAGRVAWTLRFRAEQAEILVERIRPFVPACMAYKLALRAPTRAPCGRCGVLKLTKKRCTCPPSTRQQRPPPSYVRPGCLDCGAKLAKGDLRRRCPVCWTRRQDGGRCAKRLKYRVGHPVETLACAWCGAPVVRTHGGPRPMKPTCEARPCRVKHRRWRRSRENASKADRAA